MDEKIHWKYYLFCVGLGLACNYIHLFKIFIYITSMYVHEFGHAFFAWMSGRMAMPLIGITFVFEGKYPFIFAMMLAVSGFLSYLAWKEKLYFMLISFVSIFLGSIYLYNLDDQKAQLMFIFGGCAAQILIPGWMILAAGFKSFKFFYMDFFKYFILPLGIVWFIQPTQMWTKARTDRTAIPYGSGMANDETGHQSGDINRLIAMGWSEQKVVSNYFKLVKLFGFAFVIQAGYLILLSRVPESADPN